MNATDAANTDTGPRKLFAASSGESVRYVDDTARERLGPLLSDDSCIWTHVKHNVSRTVYRCDAGETVGVLYLKHFHSRSLAHRLGRLFGVSDALHEMRVGSALAAGGVPTPRVLAAHCNNGVEWIITQGIEPAEPANDWHAGRIAAGDLSAIRRATVALAELVGRMHAVGVRHRDLHSGNVLVHTGTGNDGAELALTDLHRTCRRRRLSRRSRAANLAQILQHG